MCTTGLWLDLYVNSLGGSFPVLIPLEKASFLADLSVGVSSHR
jgi:hypothetical protein